MLGDTCRSKAPLLVQFAYHTSSDEAELLAECLHSALNDDPSVPGLRIPTLFMPETEPNDVPEPKLATEADRVLVASSNTFVPSFFP
jgi:hypothetical protein